MANPTATFETSLGSFTAEIYQDKMPVTAGNFVKLAKSGFFKEMKERRFYEKPSVKKKRKRAEAKKRSIKSMRRRRDSEY